jgi:hypothetical protein
MTALQLPWTVPAPHMMLLQFHALLAQSLCKNFQPYMPLLSRCITQEIAAYNAANAPLSAAAAAKFLQEVRNDTLGGVPVTIGTPRGMKQQNADKILLYAHPGKAPCLWCND